MTAPLRSKPGDPCPVRAEIGRSTAARLAAHPLVRRLAVPDVELFHYEHFLSRAECKALIRMIDANAVPSVVLARGDDPEFRTSFSCNLDRDAPEIARLDARISDLLGIPHANGETVQGQRYAAGQQFRHHCDYFSDNQPYWPEMEAQGGQRTWTAMVYLNAVEEGGDTWFVRSGLTIRPTQGLLLAWNNMQPDGSPNTATLHEGVRVTRGTKYIVTKWFRERPWVYTPFAAY